MKITIDMDGLITTIQDDKAVLAGEAIEMMVGGLMALHFHKDNLIEAMLDYCNEADTGCPDCAWKESRIASLQAKLSEGKGEQGC